MVLYPGISPMNRKGILSLPSMPVPASPALPRFANPLTLPQTTPGIQHGVPGQIVGTIEHLPKNLATIIPELCKGCELCVHACPSGNLAMSPGLNSKGYHPAVFSYAGTRGPCTACGICYWVCPDMAISEIRRLRQ